jgi:hypothetical protein
MGKIVFLFYLFVIGELLKDISIFSLINLLHGSITLLLLKTNN